MRRLREPNYKIGRGRTLEAAIEAALDKVPPPYKFKVIKIAGDCSPDKNLIYQVIVDVTPTVTLEESAQLRSLGTGEDL